MVDSASSFRLKRAYERVSRADGTRVLVDALWPRGIKKSEAAIARWAKELAPSTELRKWFGHDPARWEEFRKRYRQELSGKTAELEELRALARSGRVTLVFAARDELHNNAVVLCDVLKTRPERAQKRGRTPRSTAPISERRAIPRPRTRSRAQPRSGR